MVCLGSCRIFGEFSPAFPAASTLREVQQLGLTQIVKEIMAVKGGKTGLFLRP